MLISIRRGIVPRIAAARENNGRSCLRLGPVVLSHRSQSAPRPDALGTKAFRFLRGSSTSAEEVARPDFWSTRPGYFVALVLGATFGTLLVYLRRSLRQEDAQPSTTTARSDVDRDIDAVLKGVDDTQSLAALRESFEKRGLPPPSEELSRWFLLAAYGKETQLSSTGQAELQELIQKLKSVEQPLPSPTEHITIPDGKVGIAHRVGSNKAAQVLETGDHTLTSGESVTLVGLGPTAVEVSALRRSRNPVQHDQRFKYDLQVEADAKSLAQLVTAFGPSFREVIVAALADSVEADLNAELRQEALREEDFNAKFMGRLRAEAEQHGLRITEMKVKNEEAA